MAAARPIELKLKVEEFDGDRTKSNRWLRNITAYLAVNDTIYTNDEKKVVTALSYMTQGAAATWSEDYMDHAQTLNPGSNADVALQTAYGYGTWNEFVQEFKTAFSPVDTQLALLWHNLLISAKERRISPNTLQPSINSPSAQKSLMM